MSFGDSYPGDAKGILWASSGELTEQDVLNGRDHAQAGKFLFDFIASLILLILLVPLMSAIIVIVWCDGGPAFYAHPRVGKNGRRFNCLKFRTMVVDSDHVLSEILASNADAASEWKATRKLLKDPRITPIGLLLRRTSMDELPQLFNVLAGTMSLVGPRPIVDAEIVRYGEKIDYYYKMKPGITGLWQVSGRSNTTYERRIELDTKYVRGWRFRNDFLILIKTFYIIMLRKGAY